MRKKITRFSLSVAAAILLLFSFSPPAGALVGLDLPQLPLYHAVSKPDEPIFPVPRQWELVVELKEHFFSPWKQTAPRDASAVLQWVFDTWGKREIYGENLQRRSPEWIEEQRREARIEFVGELNRRAVSVCPTSLRLMPTDRPVFLSPDLPGEGYPFDYLQNSSVHPGEPLFLSHLSRDELWGWCDTSYASGWIPLSDLAFLDEKTAERWMALPPGAVIREDTLLRNGQGSFFRAKIGTLLPIISKGVGVSRVIVPVRGEDGILKEETVSVSADAVAPLPLPATPWAIASLAEQFTGEPYGWGGYLGNRDCSAAMRDLLLPFGLWLPRNSRAQMETGRSVSLEGLPPEEKKERIKNLGIPFMTLLGMPGHVMLYAGAWRGEPLVLHNFWGIRTEINGKEGRYVIGKCVISTLEVGGDLPDHKEKGLLIHRLNRMAFPGER